MSPRASSRFAEPSSSCPQQSQVRENTEKYIVSNPGRREVRRGIHSISKYLLRPKNVPFRQNPQEELSGWWGETIEMFFSAAASDFEIRESWARAEGSSAARPERREDTEPGAP